MIKDAVKLPPIAILFESNKEKMSDTTVETAKLKNLLPKKR